MTVQTMNLDDVTREIAAIITNFETVQDFVLDGDLETAKTLYAKSLAHAKSFGYRFKTAPVTHECGAIFDPNC
jgi:hypothetical protein|nr:MAG TPA: hypothetical protein [Caudoviricetes sp.]